MQSLIFFCPSKEIGGTEVLFSRIALYMADHQLTYKVKILDHINGVLTKLCSVNHKVEIIYTIPEVLDEVIIFTPAKCLHFLYEILAERKVNAKICIWQLGNGGLAETLFLPLWFKFKFSLNNYKKVRMLLALIFSTSFKHAKVFIKNLLEAKALVFTDFIGALETFKDLNLKDKYTKVIEILPIFVSSESNSYLQNQAPNREELNVGWLGRISKDFKIYSLLFTIENIIAQYYTQLKCLNFHIIGDGDAQYLMENFKIEKEAIYPNLKINLYGALSNKESIDLILSTSDIVIGMGTASLDVAKHGMPSIIINPITTKEEYKLISYRWLFESKGFSLGEFQNNIKLPDQINHSDISILIDSFMKDRKGMSLQTHLFVEDNFTTAIAIAKFINTIALCSYTATEFVQQFKPIYKKRIFFKRFTKKYQPEWLPK